MLRSNHVYARSTVGRVCTVTAPGLRNSREISCRSKHAYFIVFMPFAPRQTGLTQFTVILCSNVLACFQS